MTIERLPRLKSDPGTIRRVESILRATYNKLAMDRTVKLRQFGQYDVYKTKKYGKTAQLRFRLLADRLIREKIDPSLYVKLMSQYGGFGKHHYMPAPGFLVGKKSREIFEWLLRKERAKFPRSEDWKARLNGNSRDRDSVKNIKSSIRISWESVSEGMKNFGMSEAESVLMQLDRVSPWFMAMSFTFRGIGGMDFLEKDERRKVKDCMRFLINDNRLYKQAVKEYLKGKASSS